jgi:integrase
MTTAEQRTARQTHPRTKGTGGTAKGIGPDKKPRWRAYKSIDGKRVWSVWYPTLMLAENAIHTLKAPAPVEEKPAVYTVGMALETYLRRAVIASATRSSYETSVRVHLKSLHDIDLKTFTLDQLYQHYGDMAGAGLAHSTIKGSMAVMRNMMHQAVLEKRADVDFTIGIKIPKGGTTKVRGLKDDERLRVLEAMKGHRYEPMWRLMLLYAIRPGELTGLRWGEDGVHLPSSTVSINAQMQRARWHVPVDGGTQALGTIYKWGTKTKNGGRTIYPDPETFMLLSEWKAKQSLEADGRELTEFQVRQRAEQAARLATAKKLRRFDDPDLYTAVPYDDLVFTLVNGDPILSRWHADMWKELLDKAEVPHTRLYAARHTAINRQLRNGAPTIAVSAAAGHKNPGFTVTTYGGNTDTLGSDMAKYAL